MITSATIVEEDGWSIVKLIELDSDTGEIEGSHWVIKNEEPSWKISAPFDTVKASGSHIELEYEGTRTLSISKVLDGMNEYKRSNDFPEKVVNVLIAIGPW